MDLVSEAFTQAHRMWIAICCQLELQPTDEYGQYASAVSNSSTPLSPHWQPPPSSQGRSECQIGMPP